MNSLAVEYFLPENYERRRDEIAQKLADVRRRVATACRDAGRAPEEVTVIVVTKNHPWSDVKALYELGERHFGENRVQELLTKWQVPALAQEDIKWHQIGTLQRNKVKYISAKISLIHSVNQLSLAEEISKKALQNGLFSDILLQVNYTSEESKHGFTKDSLLEALPQIADLPGIRLRGLMTMAEEGASEARLEETFLGTKALLETGRAMLPAGKQPLFSELSMGMTQDFEVAVRCGATMVRIGSAVLGQR